MSKSRNTHIRLSKKEVKQLHALLKDPDLSLTVSTRISILLALDENQDHKEDGFPLTNRKIAQDIGVSEQTVGKIAKLYQKEGLEAVLSLKRNANSDKARLKLDKPAREKILALAKSSPPKGHEVWTVRLLAGEAQKVLGMPISAASISRLFQNPALAKDLAGLFSRKPREFKDEQGAKHEI